MGGDGVESGNVGEAQLAESVLEHGYAGFRGGGGIGGGVDCFYDLVDLGGHERVCGR